MTGHVNVGGVWKNVASGHVKVGGVWKNLSAGYVNFGGTWKQWYTSGPTVSSIIVSHTTTPYIGAYQWSNGFGTKYANPAILPTGNGTSIALNAQKNTVFVSHATTPFITAYRWSNGFGKYKKIFIYII